MNTLMGWNVNQWAMAYYHYLSSVKSTQVSLTLNGANTVRFRWLNDHLTTEVPVTGITLDLIEQGLFSTEIKWANEMMETVYANNVHSFKGI